MSADFRVAVRCDFHVTIKACARAVVGVSVSGVVCAAVGAGASARMCVQLLVLMQVLVLS